MDVATKPATPITKLDKKLEYVWMKWPIRDGGRLLAEVFSAGARAAGAGADADADAGADGDG